MPNWCNNTVEVYHPDPSKLKALVEAFNEGKFCNHIIPVPKELTETVAGHCGEGYAQDLNQFKMELNLKYFGAKDWYDFCVARWGTKWDVGGDNAYSDPVELKEGQNDVTLGFDSAWSPPVGVYEAMVEQGFSVRAYYYEPGMAFAGVWWDGDDNYFEYGGLTSEQIKEELPSELDECFGISESAAEWEAENEEEEEHDSK
jgi:hypothetical protein